MAQNPRSHSGIQPLSPDNEEIRWLVEHFISKDRAIE
jgi:hypothetical protein